MSEITCPFCAATLFDSELQTRQCTSCMRSLPPKWVPEYEAGWYGAGPDRAVQGWETVRSGVGVLSVTAFVLAGCCFLLSGGYFLGEVTRRAPNELILLLMMLAGLGLLVGGILSLLGFVTSQMCPRESGLRGLVFGTVASAIAGVMLMIGPFVLMEIFRRNYRGRDLEILALLMFFSGVLTLLISQVVLFAYFRGVARHFGDPALGGLLLTFGIVFASVFILNVGAVFLIGEFFRFRLGSPREMEMLFSCGLALESLVLLIWGGVLLWKLRNRIPLGASRQRL